MLLHLQHTRGIRGGEIVKEIQGGARGGEYGGVVGFLLGLSLEWKGDMLEMKEL